ncbi:LLM class flavin-dependent oxidoreductase [Rhodococcus sp. USK10]|uniref:LLM class flavin-dependent oxidoreductase n=1 Tax=Rhodococcus sp. USK10 TaxID=2789739 RepID=UPI001C5E5039|nr:LLM class flavin-dependent oxidoreductase [Rhodococcus sp. USK10]QYB02148.1 LLM class flavin-dependent oxidoreductase [Rhodococcus sp. USK10]
MDSGIFHNPYMKPGRSMREVLDWSVRLAQVADKAGVADFMIGEHATEGWQPIPNPEIVIGACALVTDNIRFAPMAHILPMHQPASLAIQIGWLSQVLEGRYFLGIATGAYPRDAAVRGQPMDLSEARPRMLEAIEVMEKVWKREPFHYEGDFYNAGYPSVEATDPDPTRDLNLQSDFTPWGGRQNLEIAVTGMSANSSSMRFAGQRGYLPISFYGGADSVRSHWDTYSAAAVEAGHAADRSRFRVSRDIFVADTDKEAKRRAIVGGLGYFWDRYLVPVYKRYGLLQGFIDDSGTDITPEDVTLDWLAEHVWVCGSADTVTRKLEEMSERIGGFGTIVMNSHDCIDDPEPWFESTQRLAQEVAPRISMPSPVATS